MDKLHCIVDRLDQWEFQPFSPGGVLGQVLDRDAQHRPPTRNGTRVEKGGSKLYILPNFDEK